jgi:alpha-L-rhamnosidase
MNSGNHVMLVGDIVIWFYENLAGIKADPEQPGFKHIWMQPVPVGDLKFVKASHQSPYGLIASEWHKDGNTFDWRIEIPANTTATVYIPAMDLNSVHVGELNWPATKAKGVNAFRFESGRASFELGSGRYHFQSALAE